MARIEFEGVSKVFPDGTRAVDELTLDIPDGGFTVLVGPSGSGKSTALRMVAGLEDISAGTVRIDDRIVNDIAPKDRDIARVFHRYALYPHMNVADNMGFALKMQGQVKAGIRQQITGAATRLGIGELLARGRGAARGLGGAPGGAPPGAARGPAQAGRARPCVGAPAAGVPDGGAAVEP